MIKIVRMFDVGTGAQEQFDDGELSEWFHVCREAGQHFGAAS